MVVNAGYVNVITTLMFVISRLVIVWHIVITTLLVGIASTVKTVLMVMPPSNNVVVRLW